MTSVKEKKFQQVPHSTNGFAFENLVKMILAANSWNAETQKPVEDSGADLLATPPNQEYKIAIEIKYTRNSTYPAKALQVSLERLKQAATTLNTDRAILIVSSDIKSEIKTNAETDYGVQIIDLDGLLSLASIDLSLFEELTSLCEIDVGSRPIASLPEFTLHGTKVNPEGSTLSATWTELYGTELIAGLDSISLGKKGCREFEDHTTKILKFLFDKDLAGWHEQKITNDKLHRYDLVCRVIDSAAVWKFISNGLDSRYVIFEFKNYREQIGQAQMYSTEKYLYEKAKRTVCFVVSRKGANKNALIACQGAMREHGKLIVNLDDAFIKALIQSKINGDDPNVLLFEKIDQFLMELPR